MNAFKNSDGKPVLLRMVSAIKANKDYLSEVDGLIGDGDHGANMNKGFSVFGERIAEEEISFTEGLDSLGSVLFNEIGGSMGPIYGTIFMEMAAAGEDFEEIDAAGLESMLSAALEALFDVVEARVGDKTLVDTLSPALDAVRKVALNGEGLGKALEDMKSAAGTGRDSTKELTAKYGRSSRLGERSRGVLDAGACSCCIILTAMADGILELIEA